MKKALFFILLILTSSGFAQKLLPDENGVLWKITQKKNKKVSYIFGTIHLNNPELFKFTDSTYYAFTHTDVFTPEIDIQNLFDIYDYKLNYNLLVDADQNIYKNSHALLMSSYGNPKGWPQFMDAYFYQIAVNSGKEVVPLETLSEQIATLKSIEYSDYLINQRLSTNDMLEVYLSGDISRLQQIIYQGFKGTNGYNQLITKRNFNMVDKIDSLIKSKTSTFIAVGAGHLAGENGILNLLRKKGYQIEAVGSQSSNSLSQDIQFFKNNRSYIYKDSVLHFELKFGMKPVISHEGDFLRLESRDLGQGNVYVLEVDSLSSGEDNVDNYLDENFYQPVNAVIHHLTANDGTEIREGIVEIDEYGLSWKRIFIKNGFLYKLTCSGSLMFLNSNRPKDFFDSLHFY